MRKIRDRSTLAFLAFVLAAVSPLAMAGGSESFGEYEVHYNALATDEIPPAVATGFGIVRSRNRALLNISVTRQGQADGSPRPVAVEAEVTVSASNLTGQTKDVRIRKIVEEGDYEATYYIAEINVADGETLIFDVDVKPEGSEETFNVRFKQQFFTN